jgi:hypothetical protein
MKTLLFVAAAVVLAAASSWAQTPSSPTPAPVVVPAPAATPQPLPAARWTPAQIRDAFDTADSDSNGELSRSETQRLAILPRSFEDIDQNKDGVLARAEYESAFQR